MRVTESQLREIATSSLGKARSEVASASSQLTSGLRVGKPSDDPTAWAEGMRSDARKQALEARTAAQTRARDDLSATDAALGGFGDAIQKALELAVQGMNGSYSAADRLGLAAE